MDLFDVLAIAGLIALAAGLWLLPAWAAGLALVLIGTPALLVGLRGAVRRASREPVESERG